MSAEPPQGLKLAKCPDCHTRFVPGNGPCPKCGSEASETYLSAGVGTVLASTALEVPAPPWERPHLLAMVEVEDGIRLLVVADPPLPAPGTLVEVRLEGALYRARASQGEVAGRGEGDAPAAGPARPPFEPPR